MHKLNWALFPHRMPNGLCAGEEKCLTQEEIKEANEIIGRMFRDRNRLEVIFDRVKKQFGA